MGLGQEIRQLFMSRVQTGNIVWTTYPTAVAPLADVTGVTATADAAGSKYGATKEIIAAAAIAVAFWVGGLSVNTASAADQFQVRLAQGAGDGTLFAESGIIDLSAVTANVPPIWLPIPVRLAASTRVACRLACLDAVARTLNVSVMVGTNIGT